MATSNVTRSKSGKKPAVVRAVVPGGLSTETYKDLIGKMNAVLVAPKPPPFVPPPPYEATQDDVDVVGRRLYGVGMAMLAIHRLAIDAVDSPDNEWYLTAIREISRSTVKGVDACITKLTGGPAMGNFSSEFDD